MARRVWTFIAAACILAAAGCDPASGKGSPPKRSDAPNGMRSTLSGVYTAQQAEYGKEVYGGSCISCHAGMGNHTGPIFHAAWGGRDLGEMFDYMTQYMPKNDPGGMAPDDYIAVMAYLLQINGMPAGNSPLPNDPAALKKIRFDTTSTK